MHIKMIYVKLFQLSVNARWDYYLSLKLILVPDSSVQHLCSQDMNHQSPILMYSSAADRTANVSPNMQINHSLNSVFLLEISGICYVICSWSPVSLFSTKYC